MEMTHAQAVDFVIEHFGFLLMDGASCRWCHARIGNQTPIVLDDHAWWCPGAVAFRSMIDLAATREND